MDMRVETKERVEQDLGNMAILQTDVTSKYLLHKRFRRGATPHFGLAKDRYPRKGRIEGKSKIAKDVARRTPFDAAGGG